MSTPFHFKQFSVQQDRCAAKIGTDGVLLGAWTALYDHPQSILDIGTGTGIIALQLAQRSTATTIDAVELNPDAYEQAVSNFEHSPWNDRLFCYHADLLEFAAEIDETYDLIVSNPPFYEPHHKSDHSPRDLARFDDALPFTQLLQAVVDLLNPQGQFAVIIPYSRAAYFISLAAKVDLVPSRITQVRGMAHTPIKRSLIQFTFRENESDCINEELVIEKSRHQYTEAYIQWVKDFYLKM